ncbi:MAG: hypothetical protein RBT59_13205 [Arcobacteraceae bacterium]|jgi:hypothetical protein|nr:hypothetical protein [Arcobacteraceae bacterium]
MIEIDSEEALSMDDVDAVMGKMISQNKEILKAFEIYLQTSGLTSRTISKHLDNIDFYINHYLLYDEFISPDKGHDGLDDFFGYYFPRKAMWSSANSVKENITSLKKFYSYLNELSLITNADFKNMTNVIQEEKEHWIGLYDDEFDNL